MKSMSKLLNRNSIQENVFSKFKESSLRPLKTLHELLTNCGNSIQVRTAGFLIGEHRLLEFEPQILFIDCYLDSPESLREPSDENNRITARNSSIDLLKRIVRIHKDSLDMPAIVLMSSKSVNSVDDYRHEVDDEQLLSLRFGFLDKNLINLEGSQTSIENEAVDVLLDISQGYLFGKELQNALNEWNDGLKNALKTFRSENSRSTHQRLCLFTAFQIKGRKAATQRVFRMVVRGILERIN